MKLYSAWYCPFAQRAWLALLQKEVKFDYIEIDPYQKTQQWLNISRQTGQVPVLVTNNENTIVDSNRVVEFIDEAFPEGEPLFSSEPWKKAEQKYWIDFINQKIIPYFYRFLKNELTTKIGYESREEMLKGLYQFSKIIQSDGKFSSTGKLDAVDITLIPFAYRIKLLLKYYRNFELPEVGDAWPEYHHWYFRVVESSAFKQSTTAHHNYEESLIQFYLPYSQGGGQSDVTNLT